MGFYSDVNTHKMKKFSGKWIELKNTLSEVTQAQTDNQHRFLSFTDPSFELLVVHGI